MVRGICLVAVAGLSFAACGNDDGGLDPGPDAGPAASPRAAGVRVSVRFRASSRACDSGHVTLRSSSATLEEALAFEGSLATATLRDVAAGTWKAEIVCDATVIADREVEARRGAAEVTVTGATTGFVVDEAAATIQDEGGAAPGLVAWSYYYEYRLVSHDELQAIVRLPLDPLEPFLEVSTFQPGWIYLYEDRTFYDTGADGASAFVRGSHAAERYEDLGHVVDLIDVAQFEKVVAAVSDTVWNRAESIVLLDRDDGEELLLYHVWN